MIRYPEAWWVKILKGIYYITRKKKCKDSAVCGICEKEEESVEHVLLQCDWTLVVWYGLNVGYRVDRQRITTLDKWIEEVFGMVEKGSEGRRLLLMTVTMACWQIWKERCN